MEVRRGSSGSRDRSRGPKTRDRRLTENGCRGHGRYWRRRLRTGKMISNVVSLNVQRSSDIGLAVGDGLEAFELGTWEVMGELLASRPICNNARAMATTYGIALVMGLLVRNRLEGRGNKRDRLLGNRMMGEGVFGQGNRMWTLDRIIEWGIGDRIVDRIMVDRIIEVISNRIVCWRVGDRLPKMTGRSDLVAWCRMDGMDDGLGSTGTDGRGKIGQMTMRMGIMTRRCLDGMDWLKSTGDLVGIENILSGSCSGEYVWISTRGWGKL
jgi:hypothetical protein